jgi:RHH-type proline utilization regulon transcriptional repressor/proline dehydrogenase/delta 1-pyrroline-5-carboxylate dehydrogenase
VSGSAFANEPPLELRRAPVRESLLAAGEELGARLPLSVPVLVGGDARDGSELVSVDPGRPASVVAECTAATAADVDAAVAAAGAAGAAWSARPAGERAEVLRGAAALLRARRLSLAALAMRECAKPWPEADADVCEAIDFLEYYARRAVELGRDDALIQPPGERNAMRYVGLGVAAVIAPWNFPLAIPCGMTAAALAAGNAVVLKPAPQSPACAHALVSALHEAGVPREALALLPGGDEPGVALVRHPGVHVIAFTGSCPAGLAIVRAAAEPAAGQHHVKRVIAEMGGKNCVIVDGDADLDAAVPAIVASAFGYAGQKCSAASRVLAHREVADALARRLAGAVAALRVGQADDLSVDLGPVIDAEAFERVGRYAALGASTGRALVGSDAARPDAGEDGAAAGAGDGAGLPAEGYFRAPVLFDELPADSPLLSEEIFGPVLALQAVRDVEEACDLVDELPFALTGGLFTRNPDVVRMVSARSPVGNLYVNREITGAVVGRQPFGGNRLSGTGTKAGGPDYLLSFVAPRVVSENVTRHGLVV